ncbi:MAG: NADH-quinone oxidoreductase subunit N [Saprospiraceae bacterium]|nr:NADH-quinone oxidoreductase subunit N [Saprospiraceae bacterium]
MMLALIILTLAGLLILFLGFSKIRNVLLPVAIVALVAAIFSLTTQQTFWNQYLTDMVQIDGISRKISLIIMYTALGLLPFFNLFKGRGQEELSDFLGIYLFAIIGSILMVSALNYMSLFLGVEILSISMYVLAGANRRSVHSNEASLKYFITGSFTSAIMLFGIAWIYVESASLSMVQLSGAATNMMSFGFLFLFTAFALKVALVPFHFWAPDVYQGTPTLFTASMATLVKIAAIGAFYRLVQLNYAVLPDWINWYFVLLILATLILGNIQAVSQNSVKRLFAYSGIVQSGFILMGFLYQSEFVDWTMLFYFIAYASASLVGFIVIHFVETQSGSDNLDSFVGLSKSNPGLALVLTISLISLAGGPLTAGFMAKIFMLSQSIQNNFTALALVAVISAVISMYYYYKVINAIYSKSADASWSVPFYYKGLLYVFTVITLIAGLVPSFLIGLIK